ncbi:MAG TPA: hypothetical protein VLD37_06725 [Candidatus Bilamarchaeum sp.]|nr:hypothetical protein [Candidatus Bilamarchaeum sp.]
MLKTILSMRKEEWMDPDALEKLQKERLEKILKCASNTEYYSPFLRDVKLSDAVEDLSLLPVSEKQAIRSKPLSLVQKGLDKNSLHSFKTSGTTGIPMTIYTNRQEAWERMAIVYAQEISQGRSPFDLYADISRDPSPSHPLVSLTGIFRKLKLNPNEPEPAIYETLAQKRPKMVKGYPSIFTILAKMNRKKLKFKALLSCGENLTQKTREFIGESFSCPVLDYYGAWEFRAVGWECPEEKKMHLNSSSLKIEIVDDKGKPVKSGAGNIVVTSLYNKAMPLVRYSLGDRGSWGACPCGRGYPVLKSFEGREPVLIRLPSGKIHPGAHLGVLDIEALYGEIRQFQIVQESEERFVFRHSGGELSEKSRESISKAILEACLGEEITVEFERVGEIPRGKTGKMQRVLSKLAL